jgi:hypothetical protein
LPASCGAGATVVAPVALAHAPPPPPPPPTQSSTTGAPAAAPPLKVTKETERSSTLAPTCSDTCCGVGTAGGPQ